MPPLQIYAGQNALRIIREEGINPHQFAYFLGASGGPKWFSLVGLDRVIFPEFMKYHSGDVDIIGSSAGAFRAACFVQRDPLAAVNRLADFYSHTVYSKKAGEIEITEKARELISYVLPSDGILELLANDGFHCHIIAAKSKGLMASYSRTAQMLGLVASAASNTLSRSNLKHFFERVVFSSPNSKIKVTDPYGIPTSYIEMGYSTVRDALLASGAIPLVLQGIEHIVGAPDGVYRDGGILDYHFDLQFGPRKGLILYPHFYPSPIPGWFDKNIKSRVPHVKSYDDVVMLVPSAEFVASLPYGKIPDRKDFTNMEDKPRIAYWETVLSESDRLGEYFMQIVQDGSIVKEIQPLPFRLMLG